MMNYFKPYCAIVTLMLVALTSIECLAKQVGIRGVTVEYTEQPDGTAIVTNVWNKSGNRIYIIIDGHNSPRIDNNSSYKFKGQDGIAKNSIKFTSKHDSDTFWEAPKAAKPREPAVEQPMEKESVATQEPATEPQKVEKEQSGPVKTEPVKTEIVHLKPEPAKPNLSEIIQRDAYFGSTATSEFIQQTDSICIALVASKNRAQYIINNDITSYLESAQQELADNKAAVAIKAQEILNEARIDANNQTMLLGHVIETLNNQITKREGAISKLSDAVASVNDVQPETLKFSREEIINYAIIGAIILLVIILIIVVIRRKGKKKQILRKNSAPVATQSDDGANPAIVVRRRTTSILKKQCIDDVINNPAYMVIQASEFTPDSAIRNIYIKNSCIKEVYNLYAEDLRNTENPKEDGCMVLGRWVMDEATNTYDVSLEEVVYPGDDAVFKEYELNFGGKIKLRIAERLRKLRRDTNLQYDLVCWIHSHPGLGVFFSNSDDNVQMQLKHAQHPNFLVAFVVDILTANQETGIFTFRKDGSMNAKGDLTKMYSLEDMYKWALQSERNTYNPDNHFNIIAGAKLKIPSCNGIEMNNSSIIDLTQIVVEEETGIVGWVIGTNVENNGAKEYVITGITKEGQVPAAGTIGCLITVTQMSLPTIQRLIGRTSATLSFVMVYSTTLMSLTTIPVINGELLTDEQFYGNVNIDELKTWTRRKR